MRIHCREKQTVALDLAKQDQGGRSTVYTGVDRTIDHENYPSEVSLPYEPHMKGMRGKAPLPA